MWVPKGDTGKQLLVSWEAFVAKSTGLEVTESLPVVQETLKRLYVAPGYLHVKSVEWRKCVGKKFGTDSEVYKQSVYTLGLSRQESLERRAKYTEEVRERIYSGSVETFTEEEVYRAIDIAQASYSLEYNIIAVMLSVGSRSIEVLKMSRFGVAGEGVKVTEVAKTKKRVAVVRPVLRIGPARVVELVEYIRRHDDFENMTNEVIKSRYNAKINIAMRNLFGRTVSAHKCRYIWAVLAWKRHGEGVPQQEWVRGKFAHESSDTTLTYLQYEVVLSDSSIPVPHHEDAPFMRTLGCFGKLTEKDKLSRLAKLGKKIHIDEATALQYGYKKTLVRKFLSS